jgi:hypothetical protein
MPFPRTLDELKANGYVFSNHGVCRGCKAEIEWWGTPKGKMMPFDLMSAPEYKVSSHWASCPDRDSFRK